MDADKTLRSLSDIRRYFIRNETPVYFVSATNFNLLGIDEWVRNFHYINYIDCFDGAHPSVFSPPELPHDEFESIEDINAYLLGHKAVVDYIEGHGGGKAVFLMFDERCEALCKELGLEVCFPPANLREKVDDKISCTRIGDEAGVPSVPNVLAKVGSYQEMREKSKELGEHVVVQTSFGDSGHTTFFISTEDDYNEHAKEIEAENEVKIMKKVRNRGTAIEACVTRHGTIVGPLMSELVGFKELTPYKGGWCGNEVMPEGFTPEIRAQARDKTFQLGEQLRKMGYRGYFEVDYLLDLDTHDLWLGEVNPRITGASAMTNLSAFAHADAPLFLFHLLEYSKANFELDVDTLNQRWSNPENIDAWSQMVIKHVTDDVDVITGAPPSGIYEMAEDGTVHYVRMQTHRRTVQRENRAFFLRIARVGDFRYEGADLGILIGPGRMMTEDFQLTEKAKKWAKGIRAWYTGRSLPGPALTPALDALGGFKFM